MSENIVKKGVIAQNEQFCAFYHISFLIVLINCGKLHQNINKEYQFVSFFVFKVVGHRLHYEEQVAFLNGEKHSNVIRQCVVTLG